MVVIGRGSDVTRMVDEELRELALHEVGHTLGLSHNMRASQLRSPDEIRNPDMTGVLIGSVMDYAPTNLAPRGVPQEIFTRRVGPYDTWAVQFGYQENMVGSVREEHLARSAEPALAFGNDADDMRGAGRGIDPRVMVDDMSSDAMAYAKSRFELISDVKANCLAAILKMVTPGRNCAAPTWCSWPNAASSPGCLSVCGRDLCQPSSGRYERCSTLCSCLSRRSSECNANAGGLRLLTR